MRKAFALSLSILVVLLLVNTGSRVCAQESNPIVHIYDSTFTTEVDYLPTSPAIVGIKTYSAVGPYDVILVEPDERTHTLATGVAAGVWQNFTYYCDKPGFWTAKAGSTAIVFGVGTWFWDNGEPPELFEAPELPLGTVMGTVASFGALLGLVTTRRLRRKKIET